MQLGMVGLGRMGANIVRRLMRDGHTCVVYDVSPDAVAALEAEGATGASSLDDFVDAIERCRTIDARYYVTFHHKGVVEGRDEFLRQLDAFASVIDRRDEAMLAFLAEPRTVADMVEHRFVYRPHVEITFADHVEHKTALQHLERFARRGQVQRTDDSRFIAVP